MLCLNPTWFTDSLILPLYYLIFGAMGINGKLLGNDVIVDKEQRLGEIKFSVLRKETPKRKWKYQRAVCLMMHVSAKCRREQRAAQPYLSITSFLNISRICKGWMRTKKEHQDPDDQALDWNRSQRALLPIWIHSFSCSSVKWDQHIWVAKITSLFS